MTHFLSVILLLFTFSASAEIPASGQIRILSKKSLKKSVNSKVSFGFRVEKRESRYKFTNGLPVYTTKMVARIETKKPEEQSEYGVVQFIRGCIFKSSMKTDSGIEYKIDNLRDFFGKSEVPFKHTEWVVDSLDLDPVYWSSEKGRTALYRLDDPFYSRPPAQRKVIMNNDPNQKIKYARDLPSPAMILEDGIFQNTSMEFKTCLYKLSDVPLTTTPEAPGLLEKALICYEWDHKYVYDFVKKEFKTDGKIADYCLTN